MDAILSGATPPNASELILSTHMDDILEFGKANYDYIIIDTPPISLISDAIVMMRKADVNIFVVNTKYPFRDSLNSATEIFKSHHPKNFCVLLNGVKKGRNNYYYRRYGYTAYGDNSETKTA
jgi:Mrp family chromosome partitioning ATPase